jgi:hypothetical protein
LFGEKKGGESKLHRIYVSCKTCGISEAFYSNLSVSNFKLKHVGHDVDDGSQKATPQEGRDVKTVQVAQRQPAGKKGTKLFKVVVDLMDFPAFPNPVFRVRGIKDDLSTAFILTSPFEEAARVKETLASGQYVDYGYSDMLYVWEADAVEYEGQARERLGLPGEAARRFRNPEPTAQVREPAQETEPTTVARTNEILFDVHRAAERTPANGEEQRVAPPVLPVALEPFERRVPPSTRRPLQERALTPDREVPTPHAQVSIRPERTPQEKQPAPERIEVPTPRPQVPDRLERKMVEEIPDRVMASMPDLNEAPPPPVEVPIRPVRTPVEQTPSRVLASLPELIEAPAPHVEAPVKPERPSQERPTTPSRERYEVPAARAQVPTSPERPPLERPRPPERIEVPAPRPQATTRPERKAVEEAPLSAPAPVPAKVEPPVHRMQFPVKPEQKAVEARPKEVPAAASTDKIDDTLLVSKSWYIQGGTANRNEAVRISTVLKEFRWKVEPMYTIGVMLDDILSIESKQNQMDRKVIKGVEDAGYRLTAVTADQGKVVAWFKKKQPTDKP